MATVVEEADETVYFLNVLVNAGNLDPTKVEFHRREAGELLAIFSKSLKTAREREKQSKRPQVRATNTSIVPSLDQS